MKPLLFGKYCLLERVSVGGMAEVFRAKPFDAPDFRGYLALKRILPHLAEDEEFIKMFVDEAKLTVQLNHPSIVRIYELGQFQQSYYILMEFISGKDVLALQKTMRRQRDIIPVDMAMFIAREIARGLHFAHHKRDADGNPLNIIHRDVSPQNVLIDYRGRVKVIDFGIAKAAVQSTRTQIGVLKGKMGYMSPEQVRGEVLDYRSDVFAIGTVLWEMLTNRRLFHAENEFETMQKVRDAIADPPSARNELVPPEVDAIVMKALTRDPEDRYESAAALADAIDAWLVDHPFGPEDLSVWMRTVYADDLEEERAKRDEFATIVTPDDVRRLAEEPSEPETIPRHPSLAEDSAASELADWSRPELENATETETDAEDGIWAGGIEPEEGQDISEFADQHTVVQAGGFDVSEVVDDSAEFETLEDQAPLVLETYPAITTPLPDAGPPPVTEPPPEHFQPQHAVPAYAAEDTNASRPVDAPIPRWFYAVAVLCVLLLVGGVGAAAAVFVIDEPPPTPQPGGLVVTVTPPTGIEILLDGKSVGSVSPHTMTAVAAGTHVVEVKHPDFKVFRSTIEIQPNQNTPVTVTLEPRTAPSGFITLRLPEDRAGMAVYVDGERQIVEGKKNPTYELEQGRHLLEVLKKGARPWSIITTVEPSVKREEVVNLLPAELTLEVVADKHSSVRFDGKRIGSGTSVASGIDPTEIHDLAVSYRGQGVSNWRGKLGYPEIAQGSFEVDFDKALPRAYRRRDFGYLQVGTGDDWWEVLIDGAETGLATPIDARSKLPLTPGKHRVTFQRGESKQEREIEILKGETFLFREKLDFEWAPGD